MLVSKRLALILGFVTLMGQNANGGLITGFQLSGQLGYELTGIAVPGNNQVPVTGAIQLSNIPPGAIIQQAYLYTNDFATGGGSLDFAFSLGTPVAALGNSFPTSSDPVPTAATFGYEIPLPPNSVFGNGSYNVRISESSFNGNANQMAGAGLLVIYSDPTLPTSTITVNHGVLLLGPGNTSASTTFSESSATIPAGIGSLSILTFADDAQTSGETVQFNGITIGGPLDANLPGGGSASVLNFSKVTTLGGGLDQTTVSTTGDIFGWHVAVLQSQSSTVVPEPSSFAIFATMTLFLVVPRRKRGTGRKLITSALTS